MPTRTPIRLLVPALSLALLTATAACTSVQDPLPPQIGPKAAAAPSAEGAAPSALLPATGPLTLTVQDAVLAALANNQSLAVQKINPQLSRLAQDAARAAFDPHVTGQLSGGHSETGSIVTNSPAAQVAIQEFLPTGTTITLGVSANATEYSAPPATVDSHTNSASLSVTQSLLRGAGTDVNLATLRQARLDTLSSEYELRGFAQTLLADTENAYWDYVLAKRQLEIVLRSLDLAQQQRDETLERIRLGKLAGNELAAADAEVALRQENLINARSALARTRLSLIRLINPGGERMWDREVETRSVPALEEVALDPVETHITLAGKMRPDLNQARLRIQRGELDLIKTKNGLLPRLDLFMTLGGTGYSDSFGQQPGRTVNGENYSAAAGLAFDWPVFNRAAEAAHKGARLNQRQAREAMANLSQLAEQDVRNAYLEVQRTREQIRATAATRKAQEEKLRDETEKFRLGKSTALLVGQAQRDLLSSQIAEVQSALAYMKSFVNLYRLDGSLLETRGIAAPGAAPVVLDDPRIPR